MTSSNAQINCNIICCRSRWNPDYYCRPCVLFDCNNCNANNQHSTQERWTTYPQRDYISVRHCRHLSSLSLSLEYNLQSVCIFFSPAATQISYIRTNIIKLELCMPMHRAPNVSHIRGFLVVVIVVVYLLSANAPVNIYAYIFVYTLYIRILYPHSQCAMGKSTNRIKYHGMEYYIIRCGLSQWTAGDITRFVFPNGPHPAGSVHNETETKTGWCSLRGCTQVLRYRLL